jgi:Uma2 family endonuclease
MSGSDEMRPANPGVKLTYDDYVLFPDDGKRHELIDGEHYVTPAPNWKHQAISGNLYGLIWSHLQKHPIGRIMSAPFDVIFSQFDVVEPDLVFISKERLEQIRSSAGAKGAPDLVVEIGSSRTRKRDETIKRRLYERFGVSEYWVVDPDLDIVKAYRHVTERYERVAEPALELPLTKIFED